jgi:hypothetical protein
MDVRRTACAIAVVLLAAACAEQDADGGGQGGGGSPADAAPVDLIGSWSLAEPSAEGDSVIQLDLDQVRVWRDCGTLLGTWTANAYGQFVAYIEGYSGGCETTEIPTAEWLNRTTSFAADGDARLLLDAQGEVTARLLPGAEPTAPPNLAPSEAEPPVVTDEIRRALAPAAPLPAELDPIQPDAITGRWVPADGATSSMDVPYVDLAADGGWQGSDGCNEYQGRWLTGPDGALLARHGSLEQVGCDNILVGGWLAGASRAGMDGDVLVLLDAGGNELGRLRQDT